MKYLVLLSSLLVAGPSLANETYKFNGSGTLKSVIDEVILQAGLKDQVEYLGEGSSKGANGILAKTQSIAPMSSAFKTKALDKAKDLGINVKENVIALDAVNIFVNASNELTKLDIPTIRRIFACEVTKWDEVNAGSQGDISVFVRDSASGTTETFQKLVGIKTFGDCVSVVEADELADKTNTLAGAIGYAGQSSQKDNNKALSVSKTADSEAFEPSVANVQSFDYPLARKLYVYQASGAVSANDYETSLLNIITDRSKMDKIVTSFGFIQVD